MMDRLCVYAENCEQDENNGYVYPHPISGSQPFIRHHESDYRNRNNDLKIHDLEEALSVLQEQRDRTSILFHVNLEDFVCSATWLCSPTIPMDNFLQRSSSALLGGGR